MGRVKDEFFTDMPPEEGAKCPVDDCPGHLIVPPVEGCTCHINPPCGACIDNPYECDTCKERFDP